MNVEFLFVTCCREPSRTEILKQVIDNIAAEAPVLFESAIVLDNESTDPEVQGMLTNRFRNVRFATPNLGYWSAINWWLEQLDIDPPEFTYIIESDMFHYDFDHIWTCVQFLRDNPMIGSVRLHEYSIANKHLYNKDVPTKGSKRSMWQSHINKVTGRPITTQETNVPNIYIANFLTQLPALNRYPTMRRVFKRLLEMGSFTELDFQRLYHDEFQMNAILDGGIFNCDSAAYGTKAITGSWTPKDELKRLGYHDTRFATIYPSDQYNVIRVGKI